MILLLATFALKSLIIGAITFAFLHLAKNRSAAQRSAIAHAGLIVLLLLPAGEMLLPRLIVSAPVSMVQTSRAPVARQAAHEESRYNGGGLAALSPAGASARALASEAAPIAPLQWGFLLYGLPALALLAVTMVALLRLFALRAKANVLVEPTWLSALAHAQRRMGFKSGTALLTSTALSSPISWGLLRPIILLNEEALRATGEAEAIIAHELAHVARLDWAKLLIGRLATALHWFNPLAWMLAKEAHQLREETADDAVLASNIENTDYAQLLVGVARHECKGMLLGAHGVAPGRDSLKRRVRRVLDVDTVRGPGARGFVVGVALTSLAFAAPLAALTLTGATAERSRDQAGAASLPAAVAEAVADATHRSSVAASFAMNTAVRQGRVPKEAELEHAIDLAHEQGDLALDQAQTAHGRVAAAAERTNGVKVAVRDGRGAVAADERETDRAVDRAIELKAINIDPRTAQALQNALPGRRLDTDDLAALQATHVTPEYIREMRAAGYTNIDVEDLAGARSLGVDGEFARRMQREFGGLPSLDRLMQLRVLGYGSSVVPKHGAARVTSPLPPSAPKLPRWIREGRSPPGVPEAPDTNDGDDG